jgi:hypothetical protein
MIFGKQLRSSKTTALYVGAVVFMAAFVSLIFNHMEDFPRQSVKRPSAPIVDDSNTVAIPLKPEEHVAPPPAKLKEPAKPENNRPLPNKNDPSTIPDIHSSENLKFYFQKMINPWKNVEGTYKAWGGINYEMKPESETLWTGLQRDKICIIDLDNRPFNESGEVFGPEVMSWDRPDQVHGLSLGLLNHWIYAKIHGYKYYYVNIDAYEDRRASWKKPPIMAEILKKHEACLYLDSDAIFTNLDLPFEWLMNYWNLHPSNNSMALAYDPGSDNNKDEFQHVYLNTGFIVAQNNKKTFEIMEAWEGCPEEDGKHPDCVKFRTAEPGRPTDQGGFGTYIRYDYPDAIKSLPCSEANGFPESHSGCDGTFIRHLWTGKDSWIKATAGAQMPGPYLSAIHQGYLEAKPSFYVTEKELLRKKKA